VAQRTKRNRNRTARPNLRFEAIPATRGFWLSIQSTHKLDYDFYYFALGTRGHQRQGELQGTSNERTARKFVDLEFDPVIVGLTVGKVSLGGKDTLPLSSAPPLPLQKPYVHAESRARLPWMSRGPARLSVAPRRPRRQSRGSQYQTQYDLYGSYLYGAMYRPLYGDMYGDLYGDMYGDIYGRRHQARLGRRRRPKQNEKPGHGEKRPQPKHESKKSRVSKRAPTKKIRAPSKKSTGQNQRVRSRAGGARGPRGGMRRKK
jgi:hypothetical protein